MQTRQSRKNLAEKVRFSHFYVGPGAATVAGVFDEEQEKFYYAVAFCSPEDVFSRREGRIQALKRFWQHHGDDDLAKQIKQMDTKHGIVNNSSFVLTKYVAKDQRPSALLRQALLDYLQTKPSNSVSWYKNNMEITFRSKKKGKFNVEENQG